MQEHCPNCWEPMQFVGIQQRKRWYQCGACGIFTTEEIKPRYKARMGVNIGRYGSNPSPANSGVEVQAPGQ